MVTEKMYVTGGIGATHLGEAFSFPYDLPNDTAYAETCASIGLMFFARRMLQIKPSAKYSDIMEQALYNTVLSGMALDGKSFFYVNPLEVVPEACHNDERKFHVKSIRQKWFGCACCPPNIARTLSSISYYAYTENEDVLYMHMYMAGEIEKEIHGKKADIRVSSGLPWNGNVSVKVSGCSERFTIAYRFPGWSEKATIILKNGSDVISQIELSDHGDKNVTDGELKANIKDGYIYIDRAWDEEDELDLDFAMEAVFLQADDRIREDAGKVALKRGPIVYCLEEIDNGADLHLVKVNTEGDIKLTDISIQDLKAKGIEVPGIRCVPEHFDGTQPYRIIRKIKETPVVLKYIPYFTWANRGENEMTVWVRR